MYTRTVHDIFHMKRPPRGLIVDLVDYGDYYCLRLYRDNFDSLPESTRVAATEWALETLTNINKVVPCDLEAWATPPEDK